MVSYRTRCSRNERVNGAKPCYKASSLQTRAEPGKDSTSRERIRSEPAVAHIWTMVDCLSLSFFFSYAWTGQSGVRAHHQSHVQASSRAGTKHRPQDAAGKSFPMHMMLKADVGWFGAGEGAVWVVRDLPCASHAFPKSVPGA